MENIEQKINIVDKEKGIIEIETTQKNVVNKMWLIAQKASLEQQINELTVKLSTINLTLEGLK
jgi:hypothetical protein